MMIWTLKRNSWKAVAPWLAVTVGLSTCRVLAEGKETIAQRRYICTETYTHTIHNTHLGGLVPAPIVAIRLRTITRLVTLKHNQCAS